MADDLRGVLLLSLAFMESLTSLGCILNVFVGRFCSEVGRVRGRLKAKCLFQTRIYGLVIALVLLFANPLIK